MDLNKIHLLRSKPSLGDDLYKRTNNLIKESLWNEDVLCLIICTCLAHKLLKSKKFSKQITAD